MLLAAFGLTGLSSLRFVLADCSDCRYSTKSICSRLLKFYKNCLYNWRFKLISSLFYSSFLGVVTSLISWRNVFSESWCSIRSSYSCLIFKASGLFWALHTSVSILKFLSSTLTCRSTLRRFFCVKDLTKSNEPTWPIYAIILRQRSDLLNSWLS